MVQPFGIIIRWICPIIKLLICKLLFYCNQLLLTIWWDQLGVYRYEIPKFFLMKAEENRCDGKWRLFKIQDSFQKQTQLASIFYTPEKPPIIKQSMGRSQKKDMGKVYRQFSRQKYNKYKHQFPKMRQSEIVAKIINEWDALNYEAKEKLQKQYENNKFIIPEAASESQSAHHSPVTAKENPSPEKKQEKTVCLQTPKTPVVSQPQKQNQQEQQQNPIIKETEKEIATSDKPKEADVDIQTVAKVKKMIKSRNNDYIQFFRHYYEKYSREHPTWGANQISLIIKLLWRRRKNRTRTILKQKKIEKKKKEISGKRFYRKAKGLTSEDSEKQWKRMPMQSRKLWQSQAKGIRPNSDKISKMTLKSTKVHSKIFDLFQKSIN